MSDEQLIWERYQQIFKEDFELREIDVLNRFLRSYHSEGRIVLTNKNKIENTQVRQTPRDPNYNPKPKGMWYALANEWAEFIKTQSPEWASDYTNVFLLDIDFSKILRINTPEKLIEFDRKYARSMFVDWGAVQQDGYSGVEIIPYQYEYRHKLQWYYSWDLASGCIWDSSCVRKTTKLYPRVKGSKPEQEDLVSGNESEKENTPPHEHRSSHEHKAPHEHKNR